MHSTTTSTWILNLTFITGRGAMHSTTGTWILNLTFMIRRGTMHSTTTSTWLLNLTFIPGRGTMHSTMTNTWIFNLTFITGRGTMDSTMTGSVTWILNLTFTTGAVLSLGTTMSRGHLLEMRWTTLKHLVRSYWSEPYLHPKYNRALCMARNDSNWSKPFNFLEHWQVWHTGHDNLLPSTGRENNTARQKQISGLVFDLIFSSFFTV